MITTKDFDVTQVTQDGPYSWQGKGRYSELSKTQRFESEEDAVNDAIATLAEFDEADTSELDFSELQA